MRNFVCDYCDRRSYADPLVSRSQKGDVLYFCSQMCKECKELYDRAKVKLDKRWDVT